MSETTINEDTYHRRERNQHENKAPWLTSIHERPELRFIPILAYYVDRVIANQKDGWQQFRPVNVYHLWGSPQSSSAQGAKKTQAARREQKPAPTAKQKHAQQFTITEIFAWTR